MTIDVVIPRVVASSNPGAQLANAFGSIVLNSKLHHYLICGYWLSLKSSIRRRRWLISAQGWSAATTLGSEGKKESHNPERVYCGRTLSGLAHHVMKIPR